MADPEPGETEVSEGPALAERPVADPLSRAVARSRIASALFAKHEPVKLGRYHLLEQVGAGAMGVVWGAWDPELDRRVAIKLVKTELASARERIVREGQALAKLSHPNVVPIYDVGVVDEQVYLVMEWVRGENLRVWASTPRTDREIAAVYRAAAHGLAAAHATGLIHRDFKPENAILGDDGRVRVLDFGLARGHTETSDGARAGTPKFMAPEQGIGDAVMASDQYALGVSLRESLGKTPPRWLAEIIKRSTAVEPVQRFPSMDALGFALGRDPAIVWRRRLLAVGALGLAGGAFAIGASRTGGGVDRCSGAIAEVASTWNLGYAAAVTARLRGLGPYGAQLATSLAGDLDHYGERWVAAHRGACEAGDRGELTPTVYTANLACLGRARAALGAAAELLSRTTVEGLPGSVVAARGLPDPDRCRLETQTSSVAPPPAAIAARVDEVGAAVSRARVLAIGGDPGALDAAVSASAAATQLGYGALTARAELVHGLALLGQQERFLAVPVLDGAVMLALESGAGEIAVESTARALFAIASATETPKTAAETIASVHLIEPLARGLVGPEGAFARSLLFNNVGTLALSRQDRVGARSWFEKALAARPAANANNVELAAISGNLGLVEDDHARRDALMAREGDELEAALGADHPLTLDARLKAAMFVENPSTAAGLLRAACGRYRTIHPNLVEKITQCAYELAWLADERGDDRELHDAVAAITYLPAPETAIAVGYQLLIDGKPAEAMATMQETAERLAKKPTFWAHWRVVDALIVAATAAHTLGDVSGEARLVDRALVASSELAGMSTTTFYQRRLARLHTLRARLRGPGSAAHAAAAASWYREAGGYDGLVAELDALATGSR